MHFFPGWFNETMPQVRARLQARGRRIAVLHLDGDLYGSYLDPLFHLYDLVAEGGVVICDDCGHIAEANRAILDFRRLHDIDEQLHFWPVDKESNRYEAWWWRKRNAPALQLDVYAAWARKRRPYDLPFSWGLTSLSAEAACDWLAQDGAVLIYV